MNYLRIAKNNKKFMNSLLLNVELFGAKENQEIMNSTIFQLIVSLSQENVSFFFLIVEKSKLKLFFLRKLEIFLSEKVDLKRILMKLGYFL